jgi:hypothetical protein
MKGGGMYYLKDIYVASLYQEAAVRASGAGRPSKVHQAIGIDLWRFYGPANSIVAMGQRATRSPGGVSSVVSCSYSRFNNLDYNELAVKHRATCREHLSD